MVLALRAGCAQPAATNASAAAAADCAILIAVWALVVAYMRVWALVVAYMILALRANCAKRAATAASAAAAADCAKRAAIDASAAGVAVTNDFDFVTKCSHCGECFGWPTAAATAECPCCCTRVEARTAIELAAAAFGAARAELDRYERAAFDANAAAERSAEAGAAETIKRAAAETRAAAAEERADAVERQAMGRAPAETRAAAAEARATAAKRATHRCC